MVHPIALRPLKAAHHGAMALSSALSEGPVTCSSCSAAGRFGLVMNQGLDLLPLRNSSLDCGWTKGFHFIITYGYPFRMIWWWMTHYDFAWWKPIKRGQVMALGSAICSTTLYTLDKWSKHGAPKWSDRAILWVRWQSSERVSFTFSIFHGSVSDFENYLPLKNKCYRVHWTFRLRASPARAARWARCSSRPQPPSPGSLAPNGTLGCLLFLTCLRYDIFRTFHYIINVFVWFSRFFFGFSDWTTPAHWFCCFVAISLLGSRCFFRISTVHF